MRRQDNPILQWLIARAEHLRDSRANAVPPDEYGVGLWQGRWSTLRTILVLCRWLDAEDEWVADLQDWTPWYAWRQARMAEAGVL